MRKWREWKKINCLLRNVAMKQSKKRPAIGERDRSRSHKKCDKLEYVSQQLQGFLRVKLKLEGWGHYLRSKKVLEEVRREQIQGAGNHIEI